MVSAQNLTHAAFVGYTTLRKNEQAAIDKMLRGLNCRTMEQYISSEKAYKMNIPGSEDLYVLIIDEYRVIVKLETKHKNVEVIDIINKKFRDGLFSTPAA